MYPENNAGCAAIPSGEINLKAQQERAYDKCNAIEPEPSLRARLEAKRNRLSRELVEVEEALRLVYSDPNVERIAETLKRSRVL